MMPWGLTIAPILLCILDFILSVACMIVSSEELRDYLNFYLNSRDGMLQLSTINTLNAVYACVIRYKISVSDPSPILVLKAK